MRQSFENWKCISEHCGSLRPSHNNWLCVSSLDRACLDAWSLYLCLGRMNYFLVWYENHGLVRWALVVCWNIKKYHWKNRVNINNCPEKQRELMSKNTLTSSDSVIDQKWCRGQINCSVGCQKAHWYNSMSKLSRTSLVNKVFISEQQPSS